MPSFSSLLRIPKCCIKLLSLGKINSPKYYKADDNISPKADPQELLTEDQETIMNALKGLGYME